MGGQQRQVRLTTATVANPSTGGKDFQVRAATQVHGKTIVAQGADEATALRALEVKVAEVSKGAEFKAQYPKTVVVAW
jgi:ATP-dependent helicase YprA (DUF1998 family)